MQRRLTHLIPKGLPPRHSTISASNCWPAAERDPHQRSAGDPVLPTRSEWREPFFRNATRCGRERSEASHEQSMRRAGALAFAAHTLGANSHPFAWPLPQLYGHTGRPPRRSEACLAFAWSSQKSSGPDHGSAIDSDTPFGERNAWVSRSRVRLSTNAQCPDRESTSCRKCSSRASLHAAQLHCRWFARDGGLVGLGERHCH